MKFYISNTWTCLFRS